MAYDVFLHPKAKRFLDKLNTERGEQIKSRMKALRKIPQKKGKRLKYSNFWCLRAGDYRVIYEIDRERKSVVVLFIGHRKNVYDDFSQLF